MNKKFSTLLTAGLLVVGSLFGSASADTVKNHMGDKAEKVEGGYYLLIQNWQGSVTVDGQATTQDVAFGMKNYDLQTKTAEMAVWYTNYPADEDIKNYIWQVSETKSALGQVTVTLKNYKTEQYLRVMDDGSALVLDYANASDATSSTTWAWTSDYKSYKDAGANARLIPAKHTSVSMYLPNNLTSGSDIKLDAAGLGSADCTFSLYKVKDFDVDATDLNKLYNTAGFNFNLTTEGVDNIFAAQRVKAIKVDGAKEGTDATNANPYVGFPDGTYFTVSTPATDYPSRGNADAKINWLLNCTFIAVDPTDCATTDADARKVGQGFKLTTVSGKDLNLFCSENANHKASYVPQTSGIEVSVWNACFTANTNLAGDKYSLKLKNIRYQEAAGAATHKDAAVGITVQTDLNNYAGKVLATAANGNNFIFKFAETTAVDASEFINAEGPSVYNIRLVASDTYLASLNNGNALSLNYEFYGVGDAIAEPETPAYQYVVANVDGKTLTLRNRLSGQILPIKLYEEGDGIYSINMNNAPSYTVLDVNRDGDVVRTSDVRYLNASINGAKVMLDAVEAAAVNGLDVADETIMTIAFARDDKPTSNKMYPIVNEDVDGFEANELTDDVLSAPQWKLEKSAPIYTTFNYAYLNANDKVAIKTKGDTIAHYTYKLQLVQEGTPVDNAYLIWDNGLKLGANALNFNINIKADGSAIITDNNIGFLTVTNYNGTLAGAIRDELARSFTVSNGILPTSKATDIKTYLIQDAPEISLPIETRYVTLKSELGNYISMNDENDGIVVNNDPLTFCLFATDSTKAVPSFYITTGYEEDARYFLFNPQDSISYYVGTGKYDKDYQWSETAKKAIFKAGVLNETADTLLTMVKGKATLVADKADRKGVKGGLNRFKFQIVEDADDADLYLVRQLNADGEGNNYLASINGKLTWAPRVAAMKFAIEDTTSPTSNESVAASEVSVVAVQGVIIVKGAAGKVVTVANILGQTIANQVAASDNVTIAAPAGIAVVTVDGEATKVVVK